MKQQILVITLAMALTACSRPEEATRALTGAGYTQISITGYRFFGCAEQDGWRTGFKATGAAGHQVSGVVCSGFLKGATIRTD